MPLHTIRQTEPEDSNGGAVELYHSHAASQVDRDRLTKDASCGRMEAHPKAGATTGWAMALWWVIPSRPAILHLIAAWGSLVGLPLTKQQNGLQRREKGSAHAGQPWEPLALQRTPSCSTAQARDRTGTGIYDPARHRSLCVTTSPPALCPGGSCTCLRLSRSRAWPRVRRVLSVERR